MTIRERLFELQDTKYAEFQSKLTPGIQREKFIGVRVPLLRKLAKEISKEAQAKEFLKEIPHKYYDEDMLHVLLLSEIKDYEACIKAVEEFLPYVNNWAVCDILSPKVFKKHKKPLLEKIIQWTKSDQTYTIRFGIEMLMSHYLDEDFKAEYLEIPAAVRSDSYYVQMMQAWFFATALTKQWDSTLPYIQNQHLDDWTHNKAIQKARESYCFTSEQKEYLNTLKIKKHS